MKLMPLITGLATYVPGVSHLSPGTGGTSSARYCYSVWLRHLVRAAQSGLDPYPDTVAELGPGDSIGTGLAALISGSEKYVALDIVQYADTGKNLEIFDELTRLFKERTPIPDEKEFPRVAPRLDSYEFPEHILDTHRLRQSLHAPRLDELRAAVSQASVRGSRITYMVPWSDSTVIDSESVDMIYSQAVLQHVDSLSDAYRAMSLWLKHTGYMSHAIDFKCMSTAKDWNGHWAHSDLVWKLIRGKRPFLINREPCSKHLALLSSHGFETVLEEPITSISTLKLDDLAENFKWLTEEDLVTSALFVQATKSNSSIVYDVHH